ncbi:MAG TPA: serine/threonine-protein kinase [Polyangia bacterium]|nr:serine/threonine-protein kinase [Polyangia bacterium]
MISVGDVLGGDVRVDAKIGEGGFGAVYRAHQLSVDRTVAVKALLVDNVPDPEDALDLFRAEANAIARLQHPQIPAVHMMGMHDGTPYIVMEWLEGRTLTDRLKQEGPLSDAAALKIVEQLAKPLALAHAQGILHRDLKPANIFELPDGTIKLIDFGLAKAFGPAAERGKRKPTDSGVLKGTFWFMSPEQARGAKLDARADVYSLGAVFYTLLTGRLPFDERFAAQNVPLVLAIAQGEKPLDVRVHRPVSDLVAGLVLKLMAADPDARFQNMTEVERAVRVVLLDRNSVVKANPDDRTVGMAVPNELPTRVTSGAHQPPAAAPRGRALILVAAFAVAVLASGVIGALLASRRSGASTATPASSVAAPVRAPAPNPAAVATGAQPPAPEPAAPAKLDARPPASAIKTDKKRHRQPKPSEPTKAPSGEPIKAPSGELGDPFEGKP